MARPCEKFARIHSREVREELTRRWKSHPHHRVRCRARAILLSEAGYSASEIGEIFDFTAETVRSWIDQFNERGVEGLDDEPRNPPSKRLNESDQQELKAIAREFPNQPQKILEELHQRTGKSIARRTLRDYLRNLGFVYKRFRRSLKKQRNEADFEQAEAEIAELLSDASIEVAYFDEAGFSLKGVVPYGWQPRGERLEVPVTGGHQSIQILGIEHQDGSLRSYPHRGYATSQTVIDVLDDFANAIERPTVLILDNASMHTAGKTREHMEKWADCGLHLYFLPPYSPELNAIERVWAKLKYKLMPPESWERFDTLVDNLKSCLRSLGEIVTLPATSVTPV